MAQTFRQIDAFTDRAFGGNPAAVCVLDSFPSDAWMKRLANENNLAETAYVVPRDEPGHFDLRWFTPLEEVSLCGHATLASARALIEDGLLGPGETVVFHTRSGELTARRTEEEMIELDFPAGPITLSKNPPAGLIEALGRAPGGEPLYVGRSSLEYEVCEAPHEAALRGLKPNFTALLNVDMVGVIVTAPTSDPDVDFVSRFFAPRVGVNEDHCTGSAHCALACLWSERFEKKSMRARQVSHRTGDLEVELRDDRVLLRGRAVTVFTATLSGEAAPSPVEEAGTRG